MGEKPRLTPEQFRTLVQTAPLVSLDLVILDGAGHVMVGMRTNQPARGTWFVPGGIIFKNERLDDAFRRILKAETGLELPRSQARHIGLFEHFYATNRFGEPGYGTHYVVNAYRIELQERPAVALDDQHTHVRWLQPQELLAYAEVHENTKAYFR